MTPHPSILVVYYSRTGLTRRAAEDIARRLDATLCPIVEARSRRGPLGYTRSLVEAVLERDADIAPLAVDPAGFDLVVIGTPIWGWHLSSPVRAFARRHRDAIGRCAFFCTMGSAGSARAFDELAACLQRTPLATLALTDREVEHGTAVARIESFGAALRGRDAGLDGPSASAARATAPRARLGVGA